MATATATATATAKQRRLDSNWKVMLKRWSLEQGTHHHASTITRSSFYLPRSDGNYGPPAPKIQWRGEAEKWFMTHPVPVNYDIADRVFDISIQFSCPEDENSLKYHEDMLDELQAYAESKSVDIASELFYSRNLFRFLQKVLNNKHPGIRAKAAELVTTMVQNNPMSQELVIEVNVLHLLFHNFTSDTDETSRTKALGAISSLIRNNKLGITAFREENGYAVLRDALSSENVGLQRDVLDLIQYLLHENNSDCNIVTELELPNIMMFLVFSDDVKVREAALRGLLVLVRHEESGNSGQLVKNDEKLKQIIQVLMEGISAMAPKDLGEMVERQLVESLWVAAEAANSVGEKKEDGLEPPSAP